MAATKKNVELLTGPDEVAPAATPVNRTRRRAVQTRAPRNGPVEILKPHPVALGVAHILMDAHGYTAVKAVDAYTVVVTNKPER